MVDRCVEFRRLRVEFRRLHVEFRRLRVEFRRLRVEFRRLLRFRQRSPRAPNQLRTPPSKRMRGVTKDPYT